MKRSRIVYFLFLFSGITALIYEVVWARMLTLAFGHTVFSVSIVLASFMAGLGFGSYFSGHAINHIWGKKTQSDSSSLSKEFSEDLETSSLLLIYGWIEEFKWILKELNLKSASELVGRRDLLRGHNMNDETGAVLGVKIDNS